MNGISISHLNEKYALLTFTDITSLKKQEDCLRKALALDLATGTLNKYSLMDSLQKLTDSCTSGGGFTICMIDFDNFKEVNDVYGHLMGDRVLETFSDIARKHIRKRDILGRYGGEEFIFVFPDSSEEMSLRILQRIQRELQKFFEADLKIPVTFSAGLIYVDNKEYEFPKSSDLIGSVDKMLYRAKTHGRNRAVCSKGEILFNATR
jgi:diguanylate cyclase (GGDEF)-like protein